MLKKQLVLAAALIAAFAAPTPATAAPSAVSSVAVSAKSAANAATDAAVVEVSWAPTSTAASYAVAASATGETSKAGSPHSCDATKCVSTVGGLTGGVQYSFVVTSIAADGSQADSAAKLATPTSIPNAPVAGTAVATDGTITLNWQAPSNAGGLALGNYIISDGASISQTASSDKTSAQITNITAGNSYTFTIKASNSLGSSTVATFAAVTAVAKPSAPTAPTVQVANSTLTVSWSAPSANGSPVTGYKVYLINEAGTDVGLPKAETATSTTISGVAAGNYTVKVVATNAVGDSLRSAASSQISISSGTLANGLVFSPNSLANMDIGSTQTLSVSAPSGGTVTVTAAPSSVCTYSSGVITAVASGSCTITASTPATASYAAGSATKSFNVKSQQAITFAPISEQTMPATVVLSATASSGLTVSYSASGACSVSTRTVTLLNSGQCVITASQAGTTNYSAATPVIRSFTVLAAPTIGGGTGGSVGGGTPGGGSSGGGGTIVTPVPPKRPVVIIPSQPAPKQSTYFATTASTAGAASARISGSVATVSVKVGKPVYATISGIKAGTSVATKVKTADGKVFVLSTKKIGSTGRYSSSVIKPTKVGTYSIIVSYGTVTKTLKVTVKK